MDTFSTIVTQIDPETVKMDLSGRLDRQSTGRLLELAHQIERNPAARILLDLSALDPLTGEGLQTVCVLHALLKRRFASVWMRGLNDEFRQMLTLTHLDRVAHIFQEDHVSDANSPPVVPVEELAPETRVWAQPVTHADFKNGPEKMVNLNVDRRALTSPVDSFGRMWLRTYRVRLCADLPPAEVMADWRERFTDFWPPDNSIYSSGGKFEAGSVCLINLAFPLGMVLSTGAVVIHADDTSFTLMTVQGHMFSGLITFSSYREDEKTYAQTQALVRPNDPLYELTFRLGYGPKTEDTFWIRSMKNVATHFNIGSELRCPMDEARRVETSSILIDSAMQWRHFGNVWYNAAVRSAIHQILSPIRRMIKP